MPPQDTPVPRLTLEKRQRIRSGADYERIYAARISARAPGLLVFAVRNGTVGTRFGLSVSRKNGGAVIRNRLKRLLREAFRLEQHALPTGLDLVLIPQTGPEPSLANYRSGLLRAAGTLARRLPAAESDSRG
jgi:ribonuclease P protein component